ncbi:WD40 repeat domain-containing protein [Candidatus Marithrix sp. Canyon 246]|uniref:WD40 repeat domain-containing protein n=1 Tax=Candidatus Marithrix sp. Canyon 246 TaxID=1827136 RepID=UPI000849EFFE|nr:WD40 repeat domain-containing protein [Candidatus Marithrix sp. Canyon 246]
MNKFPYPGLRSFQRNEIDLFFGREKHIDQLITRLAKNPFLAVVGRSGCGKSSLVRTGLLADLENGFLSKAGVKWQVAEMRPGNHPFTNLVDALLDTEFSKAYLPELTEREQAKIFLQAQLRRGSLSLNTILQQSPLPDGTNLLLFVDQFEEIFRYYDLGEEDEAEAFVALLLASNVYVVITMRSDFIGNCALFHGLPEAINEGQFLTPRLTREQLREAIVTPARVFGGDIDPVLVNQLLNDAGNDFDQLPLLQHALMRMWNLRQNDDKIVLTLNDYEQVGGLAHALSHHADEAFNELEPKQQKIAEILFHNLSQHGNYRRDTRRPIKLEKIAQQAEVSWQQVAEVIDVFREEPRSFLTPPIEKALNSESIIDITHESLIRNWQRLKKWSKEEAESAKLYKRLEEDACSWQQHECSLLRFPELDNALAWRDKFKPTSQWAKRYGQKFDLVMRFLDESAREQAKRAEQQAKVAKKLHDRLVVMRLFAVVAVLAAFISIISLTQTQKQTQRAEQAVINLQLNNAAWLAKFENYAKARTVLSNIDDDDNHIKNLLKWFSKLMGSGSEWEYAETEKSLLAIAVNSDASRIAVAGYDGYLALFKHNNQRKLFKLLEGHTEHVFSIGFHPNGLWLISAGADKRIIFWSASTGEKLKTWIADDAVHALAISPRGEYLATGGKGNDITLWDFDTAEKVRTLVGHKKAISDGGLVFDPTGKWLASGSHDNSVYIWDIKTGNVVEHLTAHMDTVEKLAFSPDGSLLATASSDSTVRLWEQFKIKYSLQDHKDKVYALSFIANGKRLVSAGKDKTLRIWDTESGVILRILQEPVGTINDIATYNNKIYTASTNKRIRRWDANLSAKQKIINNLTGKPVSVAVTPENQYVAVGFNSGMLQLYELGSLKLLWQQQAHQKRITRLAFNSKGNLLVSASFDKTAKLWQMKKDSLIEQKVFLGHKKSIYSVSISANDKYVATAGADGQIGLFDLEGEAYFYKAAHKGRIFAIAFNNKSTELLSGGDDNHMRLWKLYDDKPLKSVNEKQWIIDVNFSPNDKLIANVGKGHLINLYHADKFEKVKQLMGHTDSITRVIFSPDNQQVITASQDSTVRVWNLSKNSIEPHLFTLNLPSNKAIWDFDFRCDKQRNCWMLVPLLEGRLVSYKLGSIY